MDKTDADIVEEGRFFDKGEIDGFAGRDALCHCQCLGSDRPAVSKENLPRRITGGIKLFQE
jgi:hypothetical protein